MDITVGPLTSTTTVIIMEEEVLEPFILRRSWLAEVGAVASPIHQLLKFKHKGTVVSIPANRPRILYKFKLHEPQCQITIVCDKGKEDSQPPSWRKSSLWGPKPQSPPVSAIFRTARPPSGQLPIFKALGS